MNPKITTLPFLIISILPVSLAFAGQLQEVEQWLQRVQQAAHTTNYHGRFVYSQGDQLSAMRIIHSASKTGERERLVALDSTGREVIRNNDRVTCILPDSQSVVVEKGRPKSQFPPAFPVKLGHLASHYEFLLSKQEKVAGQLTQSIIIRPKDEYRYGHILWVDMNKGLLLKTHLLNEQGKIIEQFMFTQIQYLDTIPEEWLKSGVDGQHFTWYEATTQQNNGTSPADASASNWMVCSLPDGFRRDVSRMHQMPNSTKPVAHLVYSDGLASISVFIEREDDAEENLFGGSQMGAVNAYGKSLTDFHITAVGEVPHAAVKLVSESVIYKGDK